MKTILQKSGWILECWLSLLILQYIQTIGMETEQNAHIIKNTVYISLYR